MTTGEAEVGSPATNSEAHSSPVTPADSHPVITWRASRGLSSHKQDVCVCLADFLQKHLSLPSVSFLIAAKYLNTTH